MPHGCSVARTREVGYDWSEMRGLRHISLGVGRVFALLAALVIAVVPALPAHAHMHGADAALAAHLSVGPHGSIPDGDPDGGLPQKAGECCLASHVPVIPAIVAVPLPVAIARVPHRAIDRSPPPDASSEALPEPPRPAA